MASTHANPLADAAGNQGKASALYSVTVDTTAPTQTAIIKTATDNLSPVTGVVASGGHTNDPILALAGTISASLGAGEALRVYDGATLLGTATVTGTSWSYTTPALANGSTAHQLTARVEDTAGNQGKASASYSITVDTSVPNQIAPLELSQVAAGKGGFVINGQAADDFSGRSVASAGDVNGDGLVDLIVGAPHGDLAGRENVGRSYVVFGKANTTAINLSEVAAGTGGFVINGQAADDVSGISVASAGDVNGDGLADLIVGAYGNAQSGTYSGRSYVVFGKANTTAINLSEVAAGKGGFVITGQAAYDNNGQSVASAGDVNGDGLTDLIVGAFGSSPTGREHAGRSYVVFGKANNTAVDLSEVAAGKGGFVINGQAAADNNGWSVASAGDVNGDGLGDLIVGAYGSDPSGGVGAGRSYVVFGKANTTAIDLSVVAAGSGGFVINGQAADDSSGYSVASAGDVNGDGLADLIVGAHWSDPAGRGEAGRSYVVFGKANTTAINLSEVATGTGGFVINGQAAGDFSGYSVASAGDINGDGLVDLIVGAPLGDPAGGVNAGRTYVVFGKTNTAAINLSEVATGKGGFVINGQAADDNSGASVASAGDVDGDGLADLIVGAYGNNSDTGRSYVILSSQIQTGAFGAQLTKLGTASSETLTGSTGVDHIAAGAGNDTLVGGGGADVLYGGAGNDRFVLNTSNIASLPTMRIDGGTGHDTVALASDVSGKTIDLSTLNNQVFKGIERFDLTGGGDNTLKLGIRDLLTIHDEGGQAGGVINSLLVQGNSGDQIQLTGGGWSQSGSQSVSGVNYNVYVNSADLVDKLLAQQGTVSVVFA